MKSKRLTLVTSLGQVVVGGIYVMDHAVAWRGIDGVILETVPCRRRHRFMVTRQTKPGAYALFPEPSCLPGGLNSWGLQLSVDERRLFRVQDGLDPEQDRRTAENDAHAAVLGASIRRVPQRAR